MFLILGCAFCAIGSVYMAMYHWRRREAADNGRLWAGFEAISAFLFLYLLYRMV
jgi:hypothetical protein